MPTRVTESSTSGVTSHDINFRGFSGAILVVAALSLVINIVAFATTGWSAFDTRNGRRQIGLWETCYCRVGSLNESWFRAVQAMASIGLILSILAVVLIFVYMCIHFISKNLVLLLFMILSFATAAFMLIGIVVYGVKANQQRPKWTPNWSYGFAVISTGMSLAAGIMAVVQRTRAAS